MLKLLKTEGGFTLLEVLISILIATTFITVSLQGMAMAVYARILAKEQSDATLLIQEDLETIKIQATLQNLPLTGNESRCAATSQAAGFADGLRDRVLQVEGSTASTTNSSTTNSTKILSATNRQYKLQRNMTLSNNAPYNVLRLNYEVIDEQPNPDRTVAELYTEVIPDAALRC